MKMTKSNATGSAKTAAKTAAKPNDEEEIITTEVDEDEDSNNEDDDTEEIVIHKSTKPVHRQVITVHERYDATEDYKVPHSGQVVNGVPKYDESPVAGGIMVNQKNEVVNHKGHEIDPSTGDARRKAKVINPNRYRTHTEEDI